MHHQKISIDHISTAIIPRKLPFNLADKDRSIFENALSYKLPELSYLRVPDATVNYDGVAFKDGKILEESLLAPEHRQWFGALYPMLDKLLSTLKTIDREPCVLPYTYYSEGYFHWISEVIPRLFIVRELLKDAVILLPEGWRRIHGGQKAWQLLFRKSPANIYNSPYHRQSLLPFEAKEIHFIRDKVRIRAVDLIIPTQTARTGNYNPHILQGIRELYRDFFRDKKSPVAGNKIYISRKKAPRRTIVNEGEVEKVLEGFGFQSVNFEDYSFEQQVAMASQTKYLVALHGAGLTNMLFMLAGSYVLEFHKTGVKFNYCYFSLANALDIHYLYQLVKPEGGGQSIQDTNVEVDIEQLQVNINLMLYGDDAMS